MPIALKYFGGPTLAYETIAQRIKEFRLKTELAPEDLGQLASMTNPTLVDDLENNRAEPKDFAASDILALAAQVGLNVERLLPLRQGLTPDDQKEWNQERQKEAAQSLAAVDGTLPTELALPQTIELFLRFRALDELFSRPAQRLTPVSA